MSSAAVNSLNSSNGNSIGSNNSVGPVAAAATAALSQSSSSPEDGGPTLSDMLEKVQQHQQQVQSTAAAAAATLQAPHPSSIRQKSRIHKFEVLPPQLPEERTHMLAEFIVSRKKKQQQQLKTAGIAPSPIPSAPSTPAAAPVTTNTAAAPPPAALSASKNALGHPLKDLELKVMAEKTPTVEEKENAIAKLQVELQRLQDEKRLMFTQLKQVLSLEDEKRKASQSAVMVPHPPQAITAIHTSPDKPHMLPYTNSNPSMMLQRKRTRTPSPPPVIFGGANKRVDVEENNRGAHQNVQYGWEHDAHRHIPHHPSPRHVDPMFNGPRENFNGPHNYNRHQPPPPPSMMNPAYHEYHAHHFPPPPRGMPHSPGFGYHGYEPGHMRPDVPYAYGAPRGPHFMHQYPPHAYRRHY